MSNVTSITGTAFRLVVVRKDKSGNRTERNYNPRSLTQAHSMCQTFIAEPDCTGITVLAELEHWQKVGG